jgi:allantoinase
MTSLLIHGAEIADEDSLARRDLLIRDGRIAEIGAALRAGTDADDEVDLGGYLILPGAIDPHVHFEEPGNTEREDFATGTMQAAAGGITTVIEHPLTDPPTMTRDLFAEKRDLVGRHAYVDFGLWGGANGRNIGEFEPMAEEGAFGFKAFMLGSEPDYPSLDDAELLEAMTEVARIDSTMLVHAENAAIVEAGTARLKAEGRRDGLAHAQARPPIAEIEATTRAVTLATYAGCRLEVVHLSTAGAIDVVSAAAANGHAVRSEICPHFLTLTEAELERRGPWAKCTPPLRSRGEVDALWERVLAGKADFLVSDHAPWLPSEKEPGLDDIWLAGNGLISLQLSNVVVLTEGAERGLDAPAFVRLSSSNVARWLGLYPRKGSLRPGSDADLVVYERGVDDVVDPARLFAKHRWTPFEGRHVAYRVVASMLRGSWVFKDAAIVREPRGVFIYSRDANGKR